MTRINWEDRTVQNSNCFTIISMVENEEINEDVRIVPCESGDMAQTVIQEGTALNASNLNKLVQCETASANPLLITKLTQVEYDALQVKDEDTLYIII